MFDRPQRRNQLLETMPMLIHANHLWLYFVLVAGIVLLPGVDMAFVMASAITGGRRSGAFAVGGIVAGGWVHMAIGALGLGLLLQAAPRLFNVVLLAGTAYVAWIGWSLIRGATALGEVRAAPARPSVVTFVRAVTTCLLNPKAYMFMLAVFPQFVRAEYGSLMAQALALALITSLTQITVYGSIALGAARASAWLRGNPIAQARLGRAVGGLLLVAAVWTANRGWLRMP
jgi:threonine/homoserine/homoserine lactone efflux protein